MKNWILFSTILFLVTACSLDSSQEKKLNTALSAYMNAKNSGSVLSYVAYTYPSLVFEYKQKGDSIFQHKFELENDSVELCQYNNSIMRELEKDGKLFQVHFIVDKYESNAYGLEPEKIDLFAISENSGNIWFIMESEDYLNKKSCPKLKRLITLDNKSIK